MDWNEPPENQAPNRTDHGMDSADGKSPRSTGEAILAPWQRAFDVFLAPAKVMAELAREPRWFMALLMVVVLSLGAVYVNLDVMVEMATQQQLEADPNADPALAETLATVFSVISVVVGVPVFLLFVTMVHWVVFKILGDAGSFKGWFAVTAHASLIGALLALVYGLFLGIGPDGQPQTLSIGWLLGEGEGLFYAFLNGISLDRVWSSLVVALGATALSPERRSFQSAAVVVLTLMLLFTLAGAWLTTLFGGFAGAG